MFIKVKQISGVWLFFCRKAWVSWTNLIILYIQLKLWIPRNVPWSHLPYTLMHKGSTYVVLSAAITSYWSVYITVWPVNGRRVDLVNYARQAFLRRRTLPLTFIWFHFNVREIWSITLWCPWVEEFSLPIIFWTDYHFCQFWTV